MLYLTMLDLEMLSLQYLDKKDLKVFIKVLHQMFGDQEVHGVSISYCKSIIIIIITSNKYYEKSAIFF